MTGILGTKADTLDYLSKLQDGFRIEKLYILTVADFMASEKKTAAYIADFFEKQMIVVRSSSSNEDCIKTSNAGHYDSVLNVDSGSLEEVISAIWHVIDSYRVDIENVEAEQILIQKQTDDIYCSGVIFSREIKLNRPYYVITYDTASTDAVTSGRGGRTIYIAGDTSSDILPACWGRLIDAVRVLEELYNEIPLDIEFAIDSDNVVTIFQVRPLAACIDRKKGEVADDEIYKAIKNVERKYTSLCGLLGEKNTILSDMAFWNPAEIIGENPHPLDYSLYRDIITKSAWNEGLSCIGYKAVDGDLMYKLANKPYISLKKSFLSLMPEGTESNLSRKLLSYYNRKLLGDITAHDKIEFEIALSEYDLTTKKRLFELGSYGFSTAEAEDFEELLFNLTDSVLKNFKKNRIKDLQALNGLKVHRENIKSNWKMAAGDVSTLLRYVIELLESIKHYGTPKFARQARQAFISKAMCRSMVSQGYISEKEADDFMMSIYTIAAEYDNDFQRMLEEEMTVQEFENKYGHLRSGTYDITCNTYDVINFDELKTAENVRKHRKTMDMLKEKTLNRDSVSAALKKAGFNIDIEDFIYFLGTSLKEREYFKFEFTKTLSLAIDILADAGRLLGFDKYDMAFLEIDDIRMSVNKKTEDIKNLWYTVIAENKRQYEIGSLLILPDVICDSTHIRFVEMKEARPNFITSECVLGDVVLLENYDRSDASVIEAVHDKIVVITKADPGYDWIFAHGIRGFVTKYGGVASHMAIRCAEFNIPAAIGCGEVIYNEAVKMKRMKLDCQNGRIIKEE